MTIRVDSESLISGKIVVSQYFGLGAPAAEIPATGDSGAALLYNDIAATGGSPTDEYRLEMLTYPPAGNFTLFEDSSFILADAPDGVYTATYRGYKRNVTYGDFTATFVVGGQELTLTLDGGSFSYSGVEMQVSRQYAMALDGGLFDYAGADMDMVYIPATGATYVFPLSGGVFAYSGGSINMARNLALQLSGGTFNYYGAPMALNYSGAVTVVIGAYTISFMPSHTAKYEV